MLALSRIPFKSLICSVCKLDPSVDEKGNEIEFSRTNHQKILKLLGPVARAMPLPPKSASSSTAAVGYVASRRASRRKRPLPVETAHEREQKAPPTIQANDGVVACLSRPLGLRSH